jgi:L-amino acid N-acyltransferase YncA
LLFIYLFMLSAEITIRDAVEQDIAAILEIYNHVILNTTSVYSEHPHTYDMRLSWFKERTGSGFPVFVAEQDGQIIGFSSFGHFRVWPCYRYTVENSVYVHIDHRGKGISKLLLQPLIDRAREMKLHAMIAGIDADNEVSYQLHRSFGFVEVAHFKEVGFKFGRWLDLKFMELSPL